MLQIYSVVMPSLTSMDVNEIVAWTGRSVQAPVCAADRFVFACLIALLVGIVGYWAMAAWIFGWNRCWDSSRRITHCLFCAFLSASAGFLVAGSFSLEESLRAQGKEVYARLFDDQKWRLDAFEAACAELGLPFSGDNQLRVDDRDQLKRVIHVTAEIAQREVTNAGFPPPIAAGNDGSALTDDLSMESFPMSLLPNHRWTNRALDEAAAAGVDGRVREAKKAAPTVRITALLGWMGGSIVTAGLAANAAWKDIFS